MYEHEKEVIRSSISMLDVAKHIGMEVNRSGYARCPFHPENTASLRLYGGNKGWHCYGCHAGGDVISFVMQYFELKYTDALKWLSEAFSLGFVFNGNRSRLEAEKAKQRAFSLDRERKEREKATAALNAKWTEAVRRRHRLERWMRETTPFSSMYCYAANALPEADGKLDDLYEELMRIGHGETVGTARIFKG